MICRNLDVQDGDVWNTSPIRNDMQIGVDDFTRIVNEDGGSG